MSAPKVFKAYDIRGVYPDEFDEQMTRAIGRAAARVLFDGAESSSKKMFIGRDMRPSGESLSRAFADGVRDEGVDAVMLGLTSSDELYFATGFWGAPGAMFTASHNPAQYNGIKLARANAAPVGQETGLAAIKQMVEQLTSSSGSDSNVAAGVTRGQLLEQDALSAYVDFLHGLVPLGNIRPLKVVVDAGNGMAGLTVPAVFEGLPIEVIPLYFELDGTFPNHEANPIDPDNLRDLQAKVLETKADLGIAFDGDADRAFLVDEVGRPISPSAVTALIASRELAREPGATVIHNLITSRAVPEVIEAAGGQAVKTRVGHSFIKQKMAETNAIFGGEHSGHFYFRDFWRADSGMLAAMHVLAALGETSPGYQLSDLMREYQRYHESGEINTPVQDTRATLDRVRAAYEGTGVEFDDMDGLTVAAKDWWFNVRPSNTEPLIRLNVEAPTASETSRLRDEVLAVIRGS